MDVLFGFVKRRNNLKPTFTFTYFKTWQDVKGNPSALQCRDNGSAMPLHIACQHHDCVQVVKYLVELDTKSLDAMDRGGNTALHLACRNAKYL